MQEITKGVPVPLFHNGVPQAALLDDCLNEGFLSLLQYIKTIAREEKVKGQHMEELPPYHEVSCFSTLSKEASITV